MRIKSHAIGDSNITFIDIDHIKFTEIEDVPEESGFANGNHLGYFKVLLCLGKNSTEKFEAYRENTVNNPLNPIVKVGSSFDTREECNNFIKRLFEKDDRILKDMGYIII